MQRILSIYEVKKKTRQGRDIIVQYIPLSASERAYFRLSKINRVKAINWIVPLEQNRKLIDKSIL